MNPKLKELPRVRLCSVCGEGTVRRWPNGALECDSCGALGEPLTGFLGTSLDFAILWAGACFERGLRKLRAARAAKAIAVAALLASCALPAHTAEDAFHHLALDTYALMAPAAPGIPTHLCVTGTVRYVRAERDGDVHVRLCDGALCVVAEIIPAVPLARPPKGARIEACGITRYDGWPGHGWHELHPLLAWKEVR